MAAANVGWLLKPCLYFVVFTVHAGLLNQGDG